MANHYIFPVSFFLHPVFDNGNDYCINTILTKIETNVHYILFKDGELKFLN